MLEHPRAQKWISLSSLPPMIISFILPKISLTLDLYFQLPLDIPLGGLKAVPNLNYPQLSFCCWCQTDNSHSISKLYKLQFHSYCYSGSNFSFALAPHPIRHVGSAFSISGESAYISPPPYYLPAKPPPISHLDHCQSFICASAFAHLVSILNTTARKSLLKCKSHHITLLSKHTHTHTRTHMKRLSYI